MRGKLFSNVTITDTLASTNIGISVGNAEHIVSIRLGSAVTIPSNIL